MKTAERQQQGRAGDCIVKLKKNTIFTIYFWISKYRMGVYFLKTCFLNMQFKKSHKELY